jgi:Cu-processing system permease protein
MNNVVTITWLTLHEARRRRMALVALLAGAVFLALFGVGFSLINNELQQEGAPAVVVQTAHNFILIAGLYVVHFLTIMLTITTSVGTISGEIASHTIQTIVTKPIRRWQVVFGKWLGFAAMLITYLFLLAGGLLLITYLLVGYLPPNPLQGILLLMLEALVLLSLSLLGGMRFSTLANGVTLFMLYGLAFIGAWIEQIGALLQSSAAVRVGIITSLLLPVEALWRRVAYLMQPQLASSFPTPFSTSSVPSPAMVAYAMAYAAVALMLAVWAFARRDL